MEIIISISTTSTAQERGAPEEKQQPSLQGAGLGALGSGGIEFKVSNLGLETLRTGINEAASSGLKTSFKWLYGDELRT